MTTIIYDATVAFCDAFVDSRSRTVDQMVQAARSGRQNIAEGCRASAASSQTELRLINVARASLDELLLDYEDYLRQHGLLMWTKDDQSAHAVREIATQLQSEKVVPEELLPVADYQLYSQWLSRERSDLFANTVITLIHQANYLLDRLISSLEKVFVDDGGYTEQLAYARLEHRKMNELAGGKLGGDNPHCPRCGHLMVVRTAQKGAHTGNMFWGCSSYPACRGTRKM